WAPALCVLNPTIPRPGVGNGSSTPQYKRLGHGRHDKAAAAHIAEATGAARRDGVELRDKYRIDLAARGGEQLHLPGLFRTVGRIAIGEGQLVPIGGLKHTGHGTVKIRRGCTRKLQKLELPHGGISAQLGGLPNRRVSRCNIRNDWNTLRYKSATGDLEGLDLRF